MKGVIIFLMLLLSVSVALGMDAELRNPLAICDNSGNVLVSYIHSGGVLREEDIEKTATFIGTNATSKVEGYWEKGGFNYTILAESSSTASTRFYFHSVNDVFTKTGEYLLKLSFFSSSTDYDKMDVSVRIFCPGIDCLGNSDCQTDEYCGNEGKCTALKCGYGEYVEFNRCVPICNDKNPCTEDVYSNGHCLFKKTGDCCLSNSDCNDGKACTTERCSQNKCVSSPLKCEAATDKCVTSKCIEPRGCVYESDAECLGIETEKREYFITIGEPTVQRKSVFIRFGEWLDNFFRKLF